MANTYIPIASATIASSTASYTFSAIPQIYTDLVLKINARADGAANAFDNITVTFNGTGTTNHSGTRMTGNGSTVGSNRGSDQGIIMPNVMAQAGVAGSPFNNAEIYIPNYSASRQKPLGTVGMSGGNQTTAWIAPTAGLFSNTTAITSIVLTGSTNFVSGSSFYLYGIKNS